jgi:hypothetical protein
MSFFDYSADEVDVLIAGVPVTGFADGEFITIEFPESFTLQKGSDGDNTRSRTNDTTARVTIKLMQSSPSNDILSALYNADRLARNGAGVGAFMVKDNQGRSLYVAPACWIVKHPDVSFDREAQPREWVIDVSDIQPFTGGN